MIGARVTSRRIDASGATRRAARSYLQDGAAMGFAVSQDHVPVDRGTLLQSGFAPEWDGNVLRWGYRADHAATMEFGTEPFWPEIGPLLEWAERVVGDRGFGYYVQQKIAAEGIDAQPYIQPGVEAQRQWYRTHEFGRHFNREIDR